jgi:sulfite reductase (NADPH) flavoprotein alpha-component
MIKGIWRSTHFLLAVSVSIFLIIASVTGTFLGIEAIVDQSQKEAISNLDKISLKKTMDSLQNNFLEVYEMTVTEKNQVLVQGITSKGFETVYVNPKTGKKLDIVKPKTRLSYFMKNLHRSLFLKKTGRILMGFISFLTALLVITGFLLLINRIGGFNKIFSSLKEKQFFRKSHIELGRLFVIPIFFIAISGFYLTTERLDIFNSNKSTHYDYKAGEKYVDLDKFYLNKVKNVIYPFSSSENDTYKIQLSNRTITFQQGDNSLLSEDIHSTPFLIRAWAYWIHTGESNILIAILLTVTSLTLIFFIISGLFISSKTSWALFKFSNIDFNEAKIIILYGSETGNTFQFAKKLLKRLKQDGIKATICSLNKYKFFPKAQVFIFMTSTYGEGDAPSNADQFAYKFKKYKQLKTIEYTVLGFGSKSYPKFCSFAEDINSLLSQEESYSELYPFFKINNQDANEYLSWEKKLISRFDLIVRKKLLNS